MNKPPENPRTITHYCEVCKKDTEQKEMVRGYFKCSGCGVLMPITVLVPR